MYTFKVLHPQLRVVVMRAGSQVVQSLHLKHQYFEIKSERYCGISAHVWNVEHKSAHGQVGFRFIHVRMEVSVQDWSIGSMLENLKLSESGLCSEQ